MKALDLYDRPSERFIDKVVHSVALLRDQAAHLPHLAQASSLGAEDMVVTHLLQLAGLHNCRVFVLDTGKLHAETRALVTDIERRYGIQVEVHHPEQEAVVQFVRRHGDEAMYRSIELRKQCCQLRKLVPLARALRGCDGWITGLRREQSAARAEVHEVETERGDFGVRTKLSPLADWTWGDVWHFIALHRLPYNALHDRFFPSIGCEPCTRAISVGEDFRAGRWWWEDEAAKECGLHVKATPTSTPWTAPRAPNP